MSYSINVSPLTFQSGGITIAQWMSLATLCLAPLIAHIIAGAPEPTYLSRRRPKWHERMCIYSPLSILWRYAAITDRRIRALDRSPSDMAATNAIFWTSSGFDGSEEMAARSVQYCARLPKKARMTLISADSIKTLIITLQGIHTVFLNEFDIPGDRPNESMARFRAGVSVGNALSPLALFGLLRLCAAFWITDEFSYVCIDDIPLGMSRAWAISSDSLQMQPTWDIDPSFSSKPNSRDGENRFLPNSWWSRVFRFFYISVFAAVCLITLTSLMMMQGEDKRLSATGAVALSTVAMFPAMAVCIYTYYSVRNGCKSTVIPCIDKTWYKVLTAVIFLSWTIFLIFSAIETRMTPCRRYTTGLVGSGDDAILCSGLVYVGPEYRPGPLGLVSDIPAEKGNYTMAYFTGSCQGESGQVVSVRLSQ